VCAPSRKPSPATEDLPRHPAMTPRSTSRAREIYSVGAIVNIVQSLKQPMATSRCWWRSIERGKDSSVAKMPVSCAPLCGPYHFKSTRPATRGPGRPVVSRALRAVHQAQPRNAQLRDHLSPPSGSRIPASGRTPWAPTFSSPRGKSRSAARKSSTHRPPHPRWPSSWTSMIEKLSVDRPSRAGSSAI